MKKVSGYVGGRGKTVIDYVISNVESKREIVEMKVGEEVDSDHLPLIVTIKREEGKRRSSKYGKKKCMRLDWSKEEWKIFKEKYKERKERENNTEENWKSFSKELEKNKEISKKSNEKRGGGKTKRKMVG
ncbi:hypothetical protein PUN28_008286 [Cardiocondyla obscurior]|uniref:Endonuclease/exonuclease/phosphatase domain-containing protein n=1 Tax=Cardiocondyla obscurior TaxID=286306 RepID=A0AAW2FZ34_9HYME